MSSNNFNRYFHLVSIISLLSLTTVSCGISRSSSSAIANATPAKIAGIDIEPPKDIKATITGEQTLVLAGGCFWGVEAVFENLKGISNVVSGYSGGDMKTANYDAVSSGGTSHAEAVKITYNPQQISLGQILKIYFLVAHDPTQIDRQGPDIGNQYRSAIFFANSQQQQISKAYIDRLDRSRIFTQPIATKVVALNEFYPAEQHHQNFIDRNPKYPYVVVHDLPKLALLRQQFSDLVRR
ncbi:peptide-methionine (S)-S-oxide reductase MsrA [Chamaesiphon polymorphus]|uniref:Peptide methionine sulfoxide reductase MsrA n=1 Tax=Chamaesiphon polymorphus CCALA 037 TaxID=2107692 RepID=A0A2T1GHE3_9CYAN|nr:peptide-methionine (S)-S-oxide reductase MsrA [Chamaesiphon polymorphus]PSB57104.1 peptide-methionine (S)-S-oxide reductase [Chamaesiphon polymorphus CCALA 037]